MTSRSLWILGASCAAAGALCALLVGLPWWLERQVRADLAQLPEGYVGRIDGLSVRWLAGEVALEGLHIERHQPPIETPFMHVKEFVLGLELQGGSPRTRLRFVKPAINLVDAKNDRHDQWGPHFELAKLREQLPFELGRVDLEDGEIHLRVFDAQPQVDTYLNHVDISWTSLAGCLPPGSPDCDSTLKANAEALGSAQLDLDGSFARTEHLRWDLRGQMRGLSAKRLSPLLLHYADVDLQAGQIGLQARYTRQGDHYAGWLLPLLHNLDVMGGERAKTSFFSEVKLALAARRFERRIGEEGVRFQGTVGGDDFEYALVSHPEAQDSP